MARQAAESGDDGTNDLMVSDVICTNELHVWFISEHLVCASCARGVRLYAATRQTLGADRNQDRRHSALSLTMPTSAP